MGQKINPIANRLGIVRGWDSNWFGGKNYGDTILEDTQIRKYLNARLAEASISRIVIERTLKLVTVTVCTARPGFIIGKGGQEVDKLKEELKKITKKDVQIPSKADPSASTVADRWCKLGASLKSKVTISQNFQVRTPDQTNHLLGIYLHTQVSWDSLPLALCSSEDFVLCSVKKSEKKVKV